LRIPDDAALTVFDALAGSYVSEELIMAGRFFLAGGGSAWKKGERNQ